MCGRFTLHHVGREVARRFEIPEDLAWEPRYNIAPTQKILVVRPGDREREGAFLRWGLIPSWARGVEGPPLINARTETVASKPTFRESLRRRRCLIPADGFFEWKADSGRKQPVYFTQPGGHLFAFAGIWDRWEGPAGAIESVAILTTEANQTTRPFHERMPVILPREAESQWLDPVQSVDSLQELFRPCPAEKIRFDWVGPAVSSIRNDGPACIQVQAPPLMQGALF